MIRLETKEELAEAALETDSRLFHALRATEILSDIMLQHYDREYSVEYDESEHDVGLFTDIKDSPGAIKLAVDRYCDRAARAYLTGLFPDQGFVGEESFDPVEMTRDLFWVVDPICGSLGYYRKNGYFGTSVGLVDRRRGPVLGALNCPVLNIRGLAHREKNLIFLQGDFQDPPSTGLNLVVSSSAPNHPEMERMLELLRPGAVDYQGSFPAKALGVLAGTYDLCFGFPKISSGGGLKIWDLAASGAFFAQGEYSLTDFQGHPCDLTGRTGHQFRNGYILSLSEEIHQLCLEAAGRIRLP